MAVQICSRSATEGLSVPHSRRPSSIGNNGRSQMACSFFLLFWWKFRQSLPMGDNARFNRWLSWQRAVLLRLQSPTVISPSAFEHTYVVRLNDEIHSRDADFSAHHNKLMCRRQFLFYVIPFHFQSFFVFVKVFVSIFVCRIWFR